MSDDVLVYVTYGCQDDQLIAFRAKAFGEAEGMTITMSDADMQYCHGVLAIVNDNIDDRFANDLKRAYEQNKMILVAGTGQIPPNLIHQDLVMETRKLRVFEALRKLADAMCELREVCKS